MYLSLAFFALLASPLFRDATVSAAVATDSSPAWQAVHEEAEDKSMTSTAYIDNAKGSRFSLTINAVKKQKVCALLLSSPPPVIAKEHQGKILIDGQQIWAGKLVVVSDPMADIFFLDLGFDWTIPLEGMRKGNEIVIEYGPETGEPVRIKFGLKGSSKAINEIIETQSKLAEGKE
jgi:hypothetical protein